MAPNLQFCVTKPGSHTSSSNEARASLNDAIKAYQQDEELLSITQAARLYVVSKATLYRKINGRRDQILYRISKRRLTTEKEESIKNWILKIQS